MIIDLKKYLLGECDTRELSLDLTGLELDGVKPFCAPITGKITLKGFANSVLLDAHLEYTTIMPCDRCGEMSAREWNSNFSHVLVLELNDEEDNDEYIVVPDGRLNVDELLREDVLLELPSKYLCADDCKGLCPKCGKNLNEGACGCDNREIDPRLEILKSLL